MTVQDEVIAYFESLKKGLEDFLKMYPSPFTIGYQATLKEISFYDAAISALSEKKGDLTDNKGEWIPLSYRLPEDGQFILASYPSSDSGCIIVQFRESCRYNFKAWQPLPEPYEKDEVSE